MRKSRYLVNVNNEGDENAEPEEDDDDDDASDIEDGPTINGVEGSAPRPNAKSKKRKQAASLLEDRIFEVKKWTQVPMDKADKMPEPKYLADRRPGMPNYYNQTAQGAWAHAQSYGAALGDGGAAGPGYDLGDGAGLGSALGAPGTDTPPVRKNMPPRPRKKKGGPGRKKKEVVEAEKRAAEAARRKAAEGAQAGDGEAREMAEGTTEAGNETPRSKRDGEGSGDDSEGEGSEEGELNDDASPSASVTPAPASVPPSAGLNAPAIPSSLAREVTADAAPDSPLVKDELMVDAQPPNLATQITDAAQLAIPPPSAEPTVEATLTEIPPPSTELASSQPPALTNTEISVPFDPAAASESAPLINAVEAATSEQQAAPPRPTDPALPTTGPDSTPAEATEEAAVREAAVQGEAREYAKVEAVAPPAAEVGGGDVDIDAKAEAGDKPEKLVEQAAEEGVENKKAVLKEDNDDGLNLLGALEKAVDEQAGK
jgi:hypothetical protein